MLGGVVFVAHGVVGAIGFVPFLASSSVIGTPHAFLIILFICSNATSLLIPLLRLPTVFANAVHSHSDSAPRLTHLFLSSAIFSSVRLLLI